MGLGRIMPGVDASQLRIARRVFSGVMMAHCSRTLVIVVVGWLWVAPAAPADDFVEQSIPGRWITPLLPESLDKLEHPAYFKELDKARAEAFTGRYKQSLLTVRKAKGADPLAIALIKGVSLSAIGKKDEAVKALSEANVADKPEARVLKARILAEQAK